MAGLQDYANALLGGGTTSTDPANDPFQTSPNFVNPAYATPQQLAYTRQMAQQLMGQTQKPIHRASQGYAELTNALVSGLLSNKADSQQQAAQTAAGQQAQDAYATMQAGGAPSPGAGSGIGTQPMAYAPTDSSGNAGGGVGTGGALNDVGSQAMSFYQNKGLSPVAAAGLAGQFANEGGPTSINKSDGSDGSDSVGIGQWNGQRAQALQQFAAQNKMDPKDIRTQLEFSWQELNGPEKNTLTALRQAQTPADAAAAGIGYERPAGWSANNPTAAPSFGKRLASTNALLAGGQGASGGAPQAIAGATGTPDPSSGGAPPPGAMAFTGGGTQGSQGAPIDLMAHTLIHGAAPGQSSVPGTMTPQQFGSLVANPWLNDAMKTSLADMIKPQTLHGATNELIGYTPAAGATRQIAPGFVPSTANVGGQSIPMGTVRGADGKLYTHMLVANDGGAPSLGGGQSFGNGAPASAGQGSGQGAGSYQPPQVGPLGVFAPYVAQGQNWAAQGDAQKTRAVNDTNTLADYSREGVAAKASLAQLQELDRTAQKAGYGTIPAIQSILGNYNIATPGLSDIQAFQKAAAAVGANNPSAGKFGEALPTMLTTPEGRRAAVANLQALAQNKARIGEIASDRTLSPGQAMQRIAALPVPQISVPDMPTSQNGASAQGGSVPQGQSPSPTTPAAATAGIMSQARAAISRGASREAIAARLQKMGVDPSGL